MLSIFFLIKASSIMGGKLAKTTYEAGPEDSLIVKDVYTSSSSAVVNSYQDSADSTLSSIIDKIPSLNLGNLLSKIAQAISNAKNSDSNSSSGAGTTGTGSAIGSTSLSATSTVSGISGGVSNLASVSKISGDTSLSGLGDTRSSISSAYASMGGLSKTVSSVNEVSTSAGIQSSISGDLDGKLGGDTSNLASTADYLLNQGSSTKTSQSTSSYSDFDSRVGTQDLDTLTKSLSNGDMDIFSSISDLPDSAQTYLNGGLTSTQINSNVVAQIGDALTELSPELSSEAATPIANIINSITGDKYDITITNRGSSAALISAVTYLGTQMNMPNVFQTIAENVEDKAVLVEAARPLVQRAVENGDMKIIEALAETKIASDLKVIAPGVIYLLIGNMVKPVELAQQEYSKFYQAIRESFDAIDPQWSIYKRGSDTAVKAGIIGNNLFVADLIRSQMNELMHPSSYIGNLQRIYSETNDVDTDIVHALAALVNSTESLTNNSSVDLSNITVEDYDYTDAGDAVNPASDSITTGTGASAKTVSFSNEPFLLLSAMYLQDSVAECLQRDFPDWYETLDSTSIQICEY